MRETAANITTPSVNPTLDVVRNQFEAWRKRKHSGRRIPEALWQAAVELCREHSVWEVSRTSRLSYNDLKHHVHKTRDRGLAVRQRPDFGFVKLDIGAPITRSECLMEMEAPNGAKRGNRCSQQSFRYPGLLRTTISTEKRESYRT